MQVLFCLLRRTHELHYLLQINSFLIFERKKIGRFRTTFCNVLAFSAKHTANKPFSGGLFIITKKVRPPPLSPFDGYMAAQSPPHIHE